MAVASQIEPDGFRAETAGAERSQCRTTHLVESAPKAGQDSSERENPLSVRWSRGDTEWVKRCAASGMQQTSSSSTTSMPAHDAVWRHIAFRTSYRGHKEPTNQANDKFSKLARSFHIVRVQPINTILQQDLPDVVPCTHGPTRRIPKACLDPQGMRIINELL